MLRSRPCCSYKASWKGAALRFNGIRSCQLELWRIAVDSETPAEGRQWRRLRRWSAQRMQNRPHGRATDLTHDPVTQMQVPCHPPVPTRSALPGAYLRRYGSLVASRQSERALARTRSREMARALGAMPPGTGTGCPTKGGACPDGFCCFHNSPGASERSSYPNQRTLGGVPVPSQAIALGGLRHAAKAGGGWHLFGFTGPPLFFVLSSAWGCDVVLCSVFLAQSHHINTVIYGSHVCFSCLTTGRSACGPERRWRSRAPRTKTGAGAGSFGRREGAPAFFFLVLPNPADRQECPAMSSLRGNPAPIARP